MTAPIAGESPISPDPFVIRRWQLVVLALIVVLAGLLRFHGIAATSVWCDELLSIHISNGHAFSVDRLPRGELIHEVPNLMALDDAQPVTRVWGGMGGDMHPPLYYVTLRLWRDLFGDSPTGIRSLSAVLTTLAVLASFVAGREMLGTTAGLWVALLNAAASDHIYYGQEARMYAFVLLWSSAAMAIVLRMGRRGFNWRLGAALSLCSLGGMLTLYLSCAVLIACALYALFLLRGRDRWYTLGTFVVAGILFAALWAPFLLGQNFHAMKSDWLKANPNGHLGLTLERFFTLPMSHFAVLLPSGDTYAYAFAIVYLLPVLFVRRCPAIILPWLGTLLVVGFPMTADVLRTTNMLMWSRYTILMVPTLSLALVAMSWQLPARLRVCVPAALVLFCALSLGATYQKQRFDYRNNAIVAERAFNEGQGRLVFMSTWNEKFDSVLLLSAQYFWKRPPQDIIFVESPAEFRGLPRELTTDRVVLVAGDRNADLREFPEYVIDGRETWAVGVGSVTALRRLPATPTTSAPTTSVGAAR